MVILRCCHNTVVDRDQWGATPKPAVRVRTVSAFDTARTLVRGLQLVHWAMSSQRACVLVICSWVHLGAEIRRSLDRAGIHASLARVDCEPALRAALGRAPCAAVVLVTDTPGLQRDLVETHLLLHAPDTPLVVVDSVSVVGSALSKVRAALDA